MVGCLDVVSMPVSVGCCGICLRLPRESRNFPGAGAIRAGGVPWPEAAAVFGPGFGCLQIGDLDPETSGFRKFSPRKRTTRKGGAPPGEVL